MPSLGDVGQRAQIRGPLERNFPSDVFRLLFSLLRKQRLHLSNRGGGGAPITRHQKACSFGNGFPLSVNELNTRSVWLTHPQNPQGLADRQHLPARRHAGESEANRGGRVPRFRPSRRGEAAANLAASHTGPGSIVAGGMGRWLDLTPGAAHGMLRS